MQILEETIADATVCLFFHRWTTLWEERLCKKMAAFLYLSKSWPADVWVALCFETPTYNPHITQ